MSSAVQVILGVQKVRVHVKALLESPPRPGIDPVTWNLESVMTFQVMTPGYRLQGNFLLTPGYVFHRNL